MANITLLPRWLPDESLFSLVSRYHALCGHRLASHTCIELFGHPRQGSQHDFPSRIGHFAIATGEALGSAHAIVQHRTILPFFLRFLTPDQAASAVRALEGGALQGLKFQLGLLTSRFRAHHPLKACLTCLGTDRDLYGTPYWHVAHQYPGVWVCPTHGTLLCESTVKSTGVGRFLWHLPHECTLKGNEEPSTGRTEPDLQALSAFSSLVGNFARLPIEASLDVRGFQHLVMNQLKEMNLATATGRLRLTDIARAYAVAIAPLTSAPELSQLYRTDGSFPSTLGKLLRPSRGGTHPLRYLALVYWLFGSWQRFSEASSEGECSIVTTPFINKSAEQDRSELLRRDFLACVELGASPTFCAKSMGIDVNTGLIWAAQQGLCIRHRRRSLTEATVMGISQDLRAGLDKKTVATRHRVSSSTVNRLLASISGLQAEWRSARHQSLQTRARLAWQQALKEHPDAGIKQLRRQKAATFAWLYRNDRDWLTRINTAKSRRSNRPPRARVDWPARDCALAAKVQEAIQQLSSVSPNPSRKVHLWEIYQRVPELKAKLRVLRKLPLTSVAIQVARTGKAN